MSCSPGARTPRATSYSIGPQHATISPVGARATTPRWDDTARPKEVSPTAFPFVPRPDEQPRPIAVDALEGCRFPRGSLTLDPDASWFSCPRNARQ